MGRSVSKSTLGTWLTKKAWLSLAAVVVGLLAASIGMSLPGSPVVSAQSNSAPTVSISSPSSPASVYTDETRHSRQVPRTRTTTCRRGSGRLGGTGYFRFRTLCTRRGNRRLIRLPREPSPKDFWYTFDTKGDWTVKVTFTDSEGESSYVDWIVEVKDGPDPALEKIGLVSRKPYSEVGRLIPPPTVGRSFDIELDLKNLS